MIITGWIKLLKGTASMAKMINSDAQIGQVYIDGYADASGEKRHNHKLSQRRAKAVEGYLRQLQVPSDKLVVRYHGSRYPVGDNKTEAGKRKNRRATVRLTRQDQLAFNG